MEEKRPRVLIVEDEPFVVVDLETTLTDLGYRVISKALNLVDGLILAEELDFEVAVLDVNLAGLTSSRIADVLDRKGVPYLLVTGYTATGLPVRLRQSKRIGKPFEDAELCRALQDLLGAQAPDRNAFA